MKKIEKLTISNMKNGKPYAIHRTSDIELKVNELVEVANQIIAERKLK